VRDRSCAAAIEALQLENREHVLLDRQPAEDRGLLRQIADAFTRAQVHGSLRDVVAVEHDPAGVGRHEAEDQVERSRLSRAVGSEQPDDLPRSDADRDVVHDAPAAVRLVERLPDEAARGLAFACSRSLRHDAASALGRLDRRPVSLTRFDFQSPGVEVVA
jgi:hypothetical protein